MKCAGSTTQSDMATLPESVSQPLPTSLCGPRLFLWFEIGRLDCLDEGFHRDDWLFFDLRSDDDALGGDREVGDPRVGLKRRRREQQPAHDERRRCYIWDHTALGAAAEQARQAEAWGPRANQNQPRCLIVGLYAQRARDVRAVEADQSENSIEEGKSKRNEFEPEAQQLDRPPLRIEGDFAIAEAVPEAGPAAGVEADRILSRGTSLWGGAARSILGVRRRIFVSNTILTFGPGFVAPRRCSGRS